jgi:hypothetical protein
LLIKLYLPNYLAKKTAKKEANMRLKVLGALLVVGLILGVSGIVFATNGYKTQFNTRYGTTGSAIDQCILCHGANPGTLSNLSGNPYGVELQNNGINFAAAEPLDSDGDGFSNLAEITARTFPGNAASKPGGSDTTPPTVSGFTVPATSTSLIVSVTTFVATDNMAVTGLMVTESATKPLATATGWSATAPTSYTAASGGTKTLYAWAKDAAGNVSNSRSASVTITVTGPPTARNIVDFDGDGKTDVAVYDVANGWWFFQYSSTGSYAFDAIGVGGGAQWVPVRGDYDGDGKTDVAVYDAAAGWWLFHYSSGGYFYDHIGQGGTGFTAVPGDYDGDGKIDLAVYQESTGYWYIKYASGGYGFKSLGGPGKIPVQADYDGDGKTDIAVYNVADGSWYFQYSSTGSYAFDAIGVGGGSQWVPVPGDYDGDGKMDVAMYDTSAGWWLFHYSSGGYFYDHVGQGGTGFTAVVGDYDGDGKSDLTVYQASTGYWYIKYGSGGYGFKSLGGSGEILVK